MSTFQGNSIIPDALAKRLAYQYYPWSSDPSLFDLYEFGIVCVGASERVYAEVALRAEGDRDPHAVLAEARALRNYFKAHEGRPEIRGWDELAIYTDEATQVIPWAYGK